GRDMAYMPKHSLSIWNKFRLHQSADYGRLDFGVGVKAWSKSHGTWRNPAVTASNPYGRDTDCNPGYALVDIGLFWENQLRDGKRLKIALNGNKVFAKVYYDRRRFATSNTIVWGDERRALLSAQLSF